MLIFNYQKRFVYKNNLQGNIINCFLFSQSDVASVKLASGWKPCIPDYLKHCVKFEYKYVLQFFTKWLLLHFVLSVRVLTFSSPNRYPCIHNSVVSVCTSHHWIGLMYNGTNRNALGDNWIFRHLPHFYAANFIARQDIIMRKVPEVPEYSILACRWVPRVDWSIYIIIFWWISFLTKHSNSVDCVNKLPIPIVSTFTQKLFL